MRTTQRRTKQANARACSISVDIGIALALPDKRNITARPTIS